MTTAAAVEAAAAAPAVRSRRRRALTWILLAAAIVAVAVITFFVRGAFQPSLPGAGEPENHGPTGYHAVVQVLRDQGVDVEVSRSWEQAAELVDEHQGTLVLADAPALSDEALETMWRNAQTVVLLKPGARQLDLAIPGAVRASWGGEPVAASCTFEPAANAGTISPAQTYDGGDQQCFPAGEGAGFGLVATEAAGTEFVAVDGTRLFTNDSVLHDGNAALGLALLGQHDHVVWYLPSFADSDDAVESQKSLGDLTPGWVTPVVLLLMLVTVAAAVWRGRRFGPLVAERLPVTVRASETMEGRARLYARGRDAAHAGAVLRRDATRRIARSLGLGSRTHPEAVADATAAATGASRDQVRQLLGGPLPTDDQGLMDLSDRLTQLERAVHAAVRSERGGT